MNGGGWERHETARAKSKILVHEVTGKKMLSTSRRRRQNTSLSISEGCLLDVLYERLYNPWLNPDVSVKSLTGHKGTRNAKRKKLNTLKRLLKDVGVILHEGQPGAPVELGT